MSDFVQFNHDEKFDFQLNQSHPRVMELARIFETSKLHKVECKDETWQWRRTKNMAIEYARNGKPSGIAVTEADHWVHTLHDDDGEVLVHLVFPVPRLKELVRSRYRQGRFRRKGGDGKITSNVLVRLWVPGWAHGS